jgi:PHD/YefM family antitoxin component YafN of YafNO toxin-antitoxin module
MAQPRVRFIGSRELHRDLPKVLDNLEDPAARYVLTIHSKPKAVLIGTDAFLALLRGLSSSDRLLALQLGALVQGLEAAGASDDGRDAEDESIPAESELVALGA